MRINTNVSALSAHRQHNISAASAAQAIERLSSGFRVNCAADDAAGLAISEKMRAQIRGLSQGKRNAQDGISLLRTMDGAMATIHDMLRRKRELAVQALNGTNSPEDRQSLQLEIDQLLREIDDVANGVTFNEVQLMNVSAAPAGSMGAAAFGILGAAAAGFDPVVWGAGYNNDPDQMLDMDMSFLPGLEGAVRSDRVFNFPTAENRLIANVHVVEGTNFYFTAHLRGESDRNTPGAIFTITAPDGAQIVFDTRSQEGHRVITHPSFGDRVRLNALTEEFGAEQSRFVQMGFYGVAATGVWTISVQTDGNEWHPERGNSALLQTFRVNYEPGHAPALPELTHPPAPSQPQEYGDLWIQSGANKGQGMFISRHDLRTVALGLRNINVTMRPAGNAALGAIDYAIAEVSSFRAVSGAQYKRLKAAYANNGVSYENLSSAKSGIRDADMAKKAAQLTRHSILLQASTAVLAQSNALPQSVLRLLG
ncbi:MAG: hypothetical protein FWB97_07690 [Oscillospiraceae bacterium]|nr:hypothetical protein [Oscillospiraceae bacterium]